MSNNLDQLTDWLKDHKITEVECMIGDLTGITRGKISPTNKFIAEKGMRLPESVLLQTVTGDYPADNYLDLTDPDMLLRPDPASIRFVPWATDPTAQLIYDCFRSDGTPVETSPRAVLRRVLDLYTERGWVPVLAPEMEFYLLSPNPNPDIPVQPPVGRAGRAEFGRRSYSIDAVNEFDPVFALRYGDSRAVVEVEFYARKSAFLLHLAGVEGHIGLWHWLRLFLGQAPAAAFGKLRQFFVAHRFYFCHYYLSPSVYF